MTPSLTQDIFPFLSLPKELQDLISNQVVNAHNKLVPWRALIESPLSPFRLACHATRRLGDQAIHRNVKIARSPFRTVCFDFTPASFASLQSLSHGQFWTNINRLHLDLETFDLDVDALAKFSETQLATFRTFERGPKGKLTGKVVAEDMRVFLTGAMERQEQRHMFFSDREALSTLWKLTRHLEVTFTFRGTSSFIANADFRLYRRPWSCPPHVDRGLVEFLGLRTLLNMWPKDPNPDTESSLAFLSSIGVPDVQPLSVADNILSEILLRVEKLEIHAAHPKVLENMFHWTENLEDWTVIVDADDSLEYDVVGPLKPYARVSFRVKDGKGNSKMEFGIPWR